MSKMDGLRAMREARYEAAARAERSPAAPRRIAGPVPGRTTRSTMGPTRGPTARPTAPSAEAPADAETLCGHRAISGRTCTREHGHAAKSHRYS
jgi:hypothetical protein